MHGFQIAFYVLAGVAALAAVLSLLIVESNPAVAESDAIPNPAGELALTSA